MSKIQMTQKPGGMAVAKAAPALPTTYVDKLQEKMQARMKRIEKDVRGGDGRLGERRPCVEALQQSAGV